MSPCNETVVESSSKPPPQVRFDPPLFLKGEIEVTTLAEAAAYVRSFESTRMPRTRDSVLRWLERAVTDEQQHKAAHMFRAWARSEGVLPR
jgi:hypothetical protein